MSTPRTPTWYDVLGVSREASRDEVRAAWRRATDTHEPGTPQFRTYNDAADVLLDPERRAAYDASLPADEPEPAPEPTLGSDPSAGAATGAGPEAAAATRPADDEPAAPGGVVRALGRVSTLVLAVLLVLVLGAFGVAAWAGTEIAQQQRVDDARVEAPAAAEAAAKALLSYDYRTLPADRQRASRYLTGGFEREYLKNFQLLEKQEDGTAGAAVQTKAVVKATVTGTGVIDADSDRARVLVFVNQVSEKQGQDPQIFQNRVAMSMRDVDGRWLVSDLKSY
ncbi:Mce-associated membrane protein [Nocardioides scoriae]|uniref:Mce-associated membrane protein n=1 Tax=Nocardioides scoriae TaxID=642780 RepID=A0A1H1TE33_9ACTN|nr:DnaJ domain-containing protein [Nocardioides scoriae]SDS58537.1 Mce-associated membrane protein [Nocardioides scoriae]